MKIYKWISKKGLAIVYAALVVTFLILCMGVYQYRVRNLCVSSGNNEATVGECVENTTIVQTLKIPPTAKKLSLLLATYQQKLKGQLKIQLVNQKTNVTIQEWDILNETIADNRYYTLELKDDFYCDDSEDMYAIRIEGDSACKAGSSPTIWKSSADTYPDGDLYIDGNKCEGDLCFEIYYTASVEIIWIYTVLVIILLILLIIVQYCFHKFGNSIEKIFVVFVLVLGMAYMLVLPAESAPDEDRHIISAYSVSNVLLGGPENEESLVYFREKDLSGLYDEYPNAATYKSLYTNLFTDSENEDYVLVTEDFIIKTPFWTYLPQALGISLGRILDCNGTITILLGRMFSLLFYVVVTYFSIKIIPFGKMILFAVSLLPMTLELVASYSYDMLILSLTFLFIALMCRLIFSKEVLEIKDIAAPTIVFALLAPHKYVYILLVLLVVLLPGEKYKAKKEKWISAGIMFSAIIVVLLLLRAGGQRIYVPGSGSNDYRTLEYCLYNLKEVISIYFTTVLSEMSYYLAGMVGMALGWLELAMPVEILLLSVFMLFLATIKTDSEDKVTINNRHYFVFLLCAFGVFMATLTAMLFVWTPSTSNRIEGVQGRYFLPVLPLLLFCAQKMEIRSAKSMLKPVAYSGFFINTICLLKCFLIISSR